MFGFDPICVHPWNPWLKQVFHSEKDLALKRLLL